MIKKFLQKNIKRVENGNFGYAKISIIWLAILMLIILFFSLLPETTSAATITMPPNNLGLVGYWSFEDATGTVATDFSGNRNHGTLTNMTNADWVNGKIGKALDFDGTNDYVIVPYNSNLSPNTITMSLWLKPSTANTNDVSVIANSESFYDYGLRLYDNTIRFVYRYQPASRWNSYCDTTNGGLGSVTLDTTKWNYVTFSYTSGSSSSAQMYLDGVLQTQCTWTSGTGNDPFSYNSQPFNIGADNFGGSVSSDSSIDDVRIYSRTLSATEISNLYSGPKRVILHASQSNVESDGLVAYWPLDGNTITSTYAYDRTVNANTGTFTNGPIPTFGVIGSAISLDGVNDYINVPHSSSISFNSSQPFSIFTWSSRWTDGTEDTLVAKYSDTGGANTYGYRLYINSSDNLVFEFAGGDSNNRIVKISDAVVSGLDLEGFRNYGVSYDGSLQASGVKLYVNGAVVSSTATIDSLSGNTETNTPNLTIGISNGSAYPLRGKIDDVRIYNKVMPAPNVRMMFRMGNPKNYRTIAFTPPVPPIVITEGGYYGFDYNYDDSFGLNSMSAPDINAGNSGYGFSSDSAAGTYSLSVYYFQQIFTHTRWVGWSGIAHDDFEFTNNGDFSIGVKVKCNQLGSNSCQIGYNSIYANIWGLDLGNGYLSFSFNGITYNFSDLTKTAGVWESWCIERRSGVLRASKDGVTSATTYSMSSASNSAGGNATLTLTAPYLDYFYLDDLKIVKDHAIYDL